MKPNRVPTAAQVVQSYLRRYDLPQTCSILDAGMRAEFRDEMRSSGYNDISFLNGAVAEFINDFRRIRDERDQRTRLASSMLADTPYRNYDLWYDGGAYEGMTCPESQRN